MSKAFVIKNKEGKYFESQCIANGEPRFYANQFLVFTNKDEVKAVLESIAEDCDYFNIACEVVEITIAEGDLEQENKELKKQLAEQIDYKDEYYHYWQETKKELAQFTDYLDRLGFNNFNDFEEWMGTFMLTPHEEQTLIKELKEQLAIREKALKMACEDLSLYEDITTAQLKMSCYIEQAKESMKNGNK